MSTSTLSRIHPLLAHDPQGLPKSLTVETDITYRRGCGVVRTGHTPDGRQVVYRVACKTRLCQRCLPKIVADKLVRVPIKGLYATVVYAANASKLLGQLAGRRKRSGDGDYMRVPISPDKWLIVSDAPIGADYDSRDLRSALLNARPEWGVITTSEAWRTPVPEPQETSEFVDDGICTASAQWIERLGTEEFGAPQVAERSLTWRPFTDEERARFLVMVGAMPDADYWANLKSLGIGKRNDWIRQFVRRLTNR